MEVILETLKVFLAGVVTLSFVYLTLYWVSSTPWTRAVRAERRFDDACSQLYELWNNGYDVHDWWLEYRKHGRKIKENEEGDEAANSYNRLSLQIEDIVKKPDKLKLRRSSCSGVRGFSG
ncbi:MAG: hypothetical protein UT41_C0008G0006 [Candidatus Wolfebacteria bacterium GW2011_GWC2_39_22]|uniref:Uncharacterized protein n=1 Tax=Candidatus Wolfebacteria bacterium GW2011_GWC2_39_22 TaxID=1619013 RepID=A0A0G0N883_9BACT|nr:MAG: hypothetical protein UT41_C0008G0006 [Candidatus Wolfebacteria bacterium GW2011_GWC2_39_22]